MEKTPTLPTRRRHSLGTLCLALAASAFAFSPLSRAATVPAWGAKRSSPVDTPVASLKPGQWIWGGDRKSIGPMVVLVSLTEQRAYVYRNGFLEAVTSVSTGRRGHETPTGVFTILQKDANHRSSLYNSAPMPYQQRLTWDGVALHAGGLPGYPESHGCVHLPTEFARRLFEATNMGMTVVVARTGTAPEAAVHPGVLTPVSTKDGAPVERVPLDADEDYRWTPEAAPDGVMSLILSRTDERLVVLRSGVEIGRVKVAFRDARFATGTHAYVMDSDFMDGTYPPFPPGRAPRWTAIALPGHEEGAGRVLDPAAIANVTFPPAFLEKVAPLLGPGTVLVATDARILPHTTGRRQTVIDSHPPESKGKRRR